MPEGFSDNIQEMLEIYRNMVTEVDRLESMFPGRRFTLDGHFVGSIGEVAAKAYYDIILVETNKKAIDAIYLNKTVQIKTVQQDTVSIYIDENGIQPDYLLVLYLNQSGTIYEVYNGPWSTVCDSSKTKNTHGYTHISINTLMEANKGVDAEERIAQNTSVPAMDIQYRNPKKNTVKFNKAISEFAEKYHRLYEKPKTEETALCDTFPEECWALGFEMDTGNSFIAFYGHDAFHDPAALRDKISDIDEIMVLGAGIFSKWRYLTHWEEDDLLRDNNREWFLVAFDRLRELAVNK